MWLDFDRARRTGDPEVIYGQGKSGGEIISAMTQLRAADPGRPILTTRVSFDIQDELADAFGSALTFDRVARTAYFGELPEPSGHVIVVSAGTTDEPVAAEAAVTVAVHGSHVTRIKDAGVAGLHRIMSVRKRLENADVIIVCAGMDGALPSVVGGLVSVPVIAVPTSVGYGSSFEGVAALLAMLNSCAPGVTVVNIDNGFGGGIAAARIARQIGRAEAADVIDLREEQPAQLSKP